MERRHLPPTFGLHLGARPIGASALLLLLLLAPFGSLRAEDEVPGTDAEKRAFVAKCLQELRSSSFTVRETARQGLEEYGAAARDLLEAARDDADPEVGRTVRMLLARMGGEERVIALPFDDLSGMGRVTLEATGSPRVLLQELASLCGARFEWPEGHPETEISLAVRNAPYFQALDQTLAAAGLQAPQGFDASGRMALAAVEDGGAPPPLPWGAAGPMRVRVAEVTSVRTLRPPGGRRWMLALEIDWMPGVQLHQYKNPVVVTATDGEGRAYRAGAGMRASTTYGLGTTSRTARIQLHLEPEEAQEDGAATPSRLKELVFTLPVTLRHERRSVRFDGLGDLTLPATRRRGEDEYVTLTALGRPETERGFWAFDLSTRLFTDGAQVSVLVLVEGADGRIRHASAGSRFPSADGTVTLSARAYGRQDEVPVRLEVVWYGRQEAGEVRFTLQDVPLR